MILKEPTASSSNGEADERSQWLDWQNEVNALKAVKCDYIVRLINEFRDNLFSYILLELCPNGTLASHISFRESQKNPLTTDVCIILSVLIAFSPCFPASLTSTDPHF
jgi:serine/threonine protein kinase